MGARIRARRRSRGLDEGCSGHAQIKRVAGGLGVVAFFFGFLIEHSLQCIMVGVAG
jgi:hypothetical protein